VSARFHHVFITCPGGADMRDIGTLGYRSEATGINDSGQVGNSFLSPGAYPEARHAFITDADGRNMTASLVAGASQGI